MTNELGIVNKVDKSGIITLSLEELIPDKPSLFLDIKDQLFQGLILKEKDFRAWVKENNWEVYQDCYVAVYCSVDAIVPTWAYMLIATAIHAYTKDVFFCNPDHLTTLIAEKYLTNINPADFTDKRIVIKGCGDREISNHAYLKLTSLLVSEAKTVMFGEPCSTVPVFKRR